MKPLFTTFAEARRILAEARAKLATQPEPEPVPVEDEPLQGRAAVYDAYIRRER